VNEETRLHFQKAADCISDASLLLDNCRIAAAVTRVYYAMFHAATALLLERDITRSSHHAIISAFGEYLVKPGHIDARFHEHFRQAFDLRQQSDYEPVSEITPEQAKIALDRALDFVDACRKLCD
jgi:uncharacterized protein (UPF0332 family)